MKALSYACLVFSIHPLAVITVMKLRAHNVTRSIMFTDGFLLKCSKVRGEGRAVASMRQRRQSPPLIFGHTSEFARAQLLRYCILFPTVRKFLTSGAGEAGLFLHSLTGTCRFA